MFINTNLLNFINKYDKLISPDILELIKSPDTVLNQIDKHEFNRLWTILKETKLCLFLIMISLLRKNGENMSHFQITITLSYLQKESLISDLNSFCKKVPYNEGRDIDVKNLSLINELIDWINTVDTHLKNKSKFYEFKELIHDHKYLTILKDYLKRKFQNINLIKRPLKVQLGIPKVPQLKINDPEIAILAKFSDSHIILNKSRELNLKSLRFVATQLRDFESLPDYQTYMSDNLKNNRRSLLSVISSIIFLKPSIVNTLFQNIINSNNDDIRHPSFSLNRACTFFIVDCQPDASNFFIYPSSPINIIHIDLNAFCLLYITLINEYSNFRNNDAGKKDESDFSLEPSELNSYLCRVIDLKNSYFLFIGQRFQWSDILKCFYNYGIEVSGGSSVKRHLLSPIDYSLSNFLYHYSKNGYKDTVLNFNSIDKSLYQSRFSKDQASEFIYSNTLFSNYLHEVLFQLEMNIMNYFLPKSPLLNDPSFIDDEFLNHIRFYILNNIILRHEIMGNLPNSETHNIDFTQNKFLQLCDDEIIPFSSNDLADKRLPNVHRRMSNVSFLKYKLNLLKESSLNKISTQKRSYSSQVQFNARLVSDVPSILNTKTLSQGKNELFYSHLDEFIQLSKVDPVLAQRKIEEDWIHLSLKDFENNPNLLRNKLQFVFTKAKESISIDKFKNKINLQFGSLGPHLLNDKYLFLCLIILVEYYKKQNHTMLAYLVGSQIMLNVFTSFFKKAKKENLSFIQFVHLFLKKQQPFETSIDLNDLLYKENEDQALDKLEIHNLHNELFIKIGIFFIDIYMQEPISLFNFSSFNGNKKTGYRLTDFNKPLKLDLNPEYEESLFDSLRLHPKNIPMVCPPNPWGKNQYGGYLENQKIKDDIITGSVRYHNHQLSGLGRVKLYKTINYFNQIKFGINNSLLQFLLEKGDILFSEEDSEKIQNFNISLKMADLFKDIPFYLHTHADWRGRIYTHCFYLSYQGSDMSKGLLEFWDGYPLTDEGLNYFYAYGATLYEPFISKDNLEARINWVLDNKKMILEMDPYFIKKAVSPILFAAFALELQKIELNRQVIFKMPIFIDATCSGIQHLSAMIAESKLAALVNLTDYKDKPQDIYQELVEPINKAINDYGNNNPEFKNLSLVYLNRNQLKKPIMTQNYNVSIFGMKEQLFDILHEEEKIYDESEDSNIRKRIKIIAKSKEGNEIVLTNKDLIRMAMIIKEVIFVQFPVLKEIYEYFLNIAKLMEVLNLPVNWLTPTGAVITQEYRKKSKTAVRLTLFNKTKINHIQKATKDIDFKKQQDGIIPNVIHSLDSSNIINLIQEMKPDLEAPVLTIHDCFGTHPNFINVLHFRLKEEFINLYIDNKFLKLFQKRIIQNIKDNNYDIIRESKKQYVLIYNTSLNINEKLLIPTPPIKNNLDLKNIIYSKYMFN